MALTLIVEDGSSKTDSNTYLSLADTEEYFDGRLNKGAWANTNEAEKKAAKVQATRILDSYVKWYGYKTDVDQARQWPQLGASSEEYIIDSDEIPTEIKDAECELSLVLISQDTQKVSDTAGLKSISVAGTVNIDIDKSDRINEIPSHVWKLISHLGQKKGGANVLLQRG